MTPGAAILDFIVPAYRAAATIGDAMRSVIAQTRADWRATVIDDGSDDDTADAARAIGDARIAVISQPNAGPAAARRRGVEATSAPLVCFLDADDAVGPRFLERMAAAIEGFDLAACGHRFAGPDLRDLDWPVLHGPEDATLERLAECNPFALGAVVVRRAAAMRLGLGSDWFAGGSRHEDWEFLLRLTAAGARWAPPVAGAMMTYRLRAGSRSSDVAAMWRDGLALIERYHTAPAAAKRAWTVRHLAQAIAADDAGLVDELRRELGTLGARDADAFGAAWRWAVRRASAVDPGSPTIGDRVRRLRLALDGDPAGEILARRAGAAALDWAEVARAASARLGPGRRLVVFGAGQNGGALLRQLARLGTPTAFIDDRLDARADAPRIGVGDLTSGDVVLVTPERRDAIVARLRGTRAGEVWVPEGVGVHAGDPDGHTTTP